MPYNKTSSSLELNLATKFEICKMMFKLSLTTSLIAGILSLPGLGKVAQATASTKEIEKTANDRSSLAISKNSLNAKNKSNTSGFVPKISHSVGSVRTLITNLASLYSAKDHRANDSISNPTDAELGSTSSDPKTANINPGSNFILANQNLAISSESTTSLAAKAKAGVHIVSRGDTRSSVAEEDPYITKLKAEIEQLRNQKQQSPQANRNTSASRNSRSSSGRVRPTTHKTLPNIETVSVVTSVPASNSLAGLLPEDSIALQLPPLPPADEYLPSAFDGYIWPAQGILTSGYGWRWGRMHQGIDIAAPVGTPILAAASGEVINAGWHSGYGNLIKLKHLDGSVTVYAHNHKNLVTHGQKVDQGEQIAEMGNTGRSTGSHLHFEIHSADEAAINPLALLGDK